MMRGLFAALLFASILGPLHGATTPTKKTPGKKRTAPGSAAVRKKLPAETKPAASVPAEKPSVPEPTAGDSGNATLEPSALVEFSTQPAPVQQLITSALTLTKQNLSYTYGSADPASGGMDCSGAIFYLLEQQGLAGVPRDSAGQYVWVRKAGGFRAVNSTKAESFEFSDLLPGDLMFWSGTYEVKRDFPITHVMLYLGKERKTGKRVMVGASDGRSYAGVSRSGVSVFDFKMPTEKISGEPAKARFIGYGRIPGVREISSAAPIASVPTEEKVASSKTAPAKSKAPTKSKSRR